MRINGVLVDNMLRAYRRAESGTNSRAAAATVTVGTVLYAKALSRSGHTSALDEDGCRRENAS
jgi:hypothetical protein